MNKKLILTLTALPIAACFSSNKAPPLDKSEDKTWKLVWADEFDTDGLPDSDKWNYDVGGEGWGNNEKQFYTERRIENAYVKDGYLSIAARKEDWEDNRYTSARLVTKGKQAWTHGRFEIRAKIPGGRGSWPAIWMLPVDWNLGSGDWPDVGEIDIMEHVGHDKGTIHFSAHSKDYQWQKGTQKTATTLLPDACETFHTYSAEWDEHSIKGFIDNVLYFEYENENKGWSKWPYTQDFYIILNVAVGGEWGEVKGIDDDAFPQTMEIDFVRVYQED